MKIALLNDTQIGIHNNSLIFSKNQQVFFEKVFFPYCVENEISTIFHLGDYFDNRRKIDAKILKIHKEVFLDRLISLDMKMFVILGNHDIYHDNSFELSLVKEILSQYSNNVTIIEKPVTTIMDSYGMDLLCIPWIHKNNREECFSAIENCEEPQYTVILGHLDITGFEFMKGIKQTSGTISSPKIFSKFMNVYSGHFHSKQQLGNVIYLGSQTQFTKAEFGEKKFFHVLDTEYGNLEAIENPYNLFEKIEYVEDDTIIENNYEGKFVRLIVPQNLTKQKLQQLDGFILKIREQNPVEIEIIEVDNVIQNSSIDFVGREFNSKFDTRFSFDTPTIIEELVKRNLSHDNDLLQSVTKEILTIYAEAASEELSKKNDTI